MFAVMSETDVTSNRNNVAVAVPVRVSLRINKLKVLAQSTEPKLPVEKSIDSAAAAAATGPKPEATWFTGDTGIQNVKATLSCNAAPNHDDNNVKCTVGQSACVESQQAKANVTEVEKKISVSCKSVTKFCGPKEGEWTLDKRALPLTVGAGSIDGQVGAAQTEDVSQASSWWAARLSHLPSHILRLLLSGHIDSPRESLTLEKAEAIERMPPRFPKLGSPTRRNEDTMASGPSWQELCPPGWTEDPTRGAINI